MLNSYLLDSNAMLWLAEESARLGPIARETIRTAHYVHISAVSLFELRQKERKGKLKLPLHFEAELIRNGLRELPLTFEHVQAFRWLTIAHKDPFDLMLVAQADASGLTLITADRTLLKQYHATLDARL